MPAGIVSVLAAFAALCGFGETFYWQQDGMLAGTANYGNYNDSANWSLSRTSYSNPEGEIPGSGDYLYGWPPTVPSGSAYGKVLGYFDLGGNSRSLAGLSAGDMTSSDGYRNCSYEIGVMNGTLSFPALARFNPGGATGTDGWRGSVYTWRAAGDGDVGQRFVKPELKSL